MQKLYFYDPSFGITIFIEKFNKLSFLEDHISTKVMISFNKIGDDSPGIFILIISNVFIQNSTKC